MPTSAVVSQRYLPCALRQPGVLALFKTVEKWQQAFPTLLEIHRNNHTDGASSRSGHLGSPAPPDTFDLNFHQCSNRRIIEEVGPRARQEAHPILEPGRPNWRPGDATAAVVAPLRATRRTPRFHLATSTQLVRQDTEISQNTEGPARTRSSHVDCSAESDRGGSVRRRACTPAQSRSARLW